MRTDCFSPSHTSPFLSQSVYAKYLERVSGKKREEKKSGRWYKYMRSDIYKEMLHGRRKNMADAELYV